MTHDLRANNLTLGYADADIVRDLDVAIPDGRITVIVGANACGKSTLLRGLARLLRPRSGQRPPPADIPKLRATTPLCIWSCHRKRMSYAIELLP